MGRRKTIEKGEPSKLMITRERKTSLEIESVNAVFNNPLLMDKIVKYSIYSPSGKQINKPTIIELRLVNKGWLQSTSRVLTKSGEWTINLSIVSKYDRNRLNEKIYDSARGNILDRFVSVFSKASRSLDSILPIYISIGQAYFLHENRENLSNFLEQCGDIIGTLCVIYPLDGDSMNLTSIEFQFAILQHLKYSYITRRHPVSNSTNNENGLKLLQHILQNSPSLQRLTWINSQKAVLNANSIILPPTIKTLTFTPDPVTENELTLFRTNQLPNLNTLDFCIDKQTEIHLTYKFLENFQQQLTSLYLKVNANDGDNNESRICVKFPKMPKMKFLKLSGQNYTLLPELRHVWPNLVPNLTRLVLKNLSETLFLEWIQGCRFENVKKLKFSLKHNGGESFLDTLSPNVQIIKEIISSFPKIEKLNLRFTTTEMSSLKYIFQNFTHLKRLHLSFKHDDSDTVPGYELVSIFLGISLELAKVMVYETDKNVSVAVDNPVSIMNLTELNSLTLKIPRYFFPARAETNYFSEIISKHGLDKMPKLRKIKLLGGFKEQPIYKWFK